MLKVKTFGASEMIEDEGINMAVIVHVAKMSTTDYLYKEVF